MEESEPTLKETLKLVYNALDSRKIKKINIPRKAKCGKGKIKKGWVGILKIDENGNLSGEKVLLSGSCFKTKEGNYHASDGREILFWQGKFPVIIQPSWRENPLNIRDVYTEKIENGKKIYISNETYGQEYIMAKMLRDTIVQKSKAGNIILWIGLGIGVIYLISKFFGS